MNLKKSVKNKRRVRDDGICKYIYFSDRKSNISLEKQEQHYKIDGDGVHHPIVRIFRQWRILNHIYSLSVAY